jgi:putative addiction module component (TIGR02574 family)
MNSKLEKVFEEAKALSDEERDRLIQMLEAHDRCDLSQAEIEREWNEEAVRRYQEYKEGKVEAIPLDEALSRIRDRLAK